jgi:hypothetical protein
MTCYADAAPEKQIKTILCKCVALSDIAAFVAPKKTQRAAPAVSNKSIALPLFSFWDGIRGSPRAEVINAHQVTRFLLIRPKFATEPTWRRRVLLIRPISLVHLAAEPTWRRQGQSNEPKQKPCHNARHCRGEVLKTRVRLA